MKNLRRLYKDHKLTFVLLVIAVLFQLAAGRHCGDETEDIYYSVWTTNNSSVTVKAVAYFNDSSRSAVISPGSKANISLDDAKSFTLVVKPMEDWLSYATRKSDRLVAELATAKESNKPDDIASITAQLSDIQAKISSYSEGENKKSCQGTSIASGNTATISDSDSAPGAIALSCN